MVCVCVCVVGKVLLQIVKARATEVHPLQLPELSTYKKTIPSLARASGFPSAKWVTVAQATPSSSAEMLQNAWHSGRRRVNWHSPCLSSGARCQARGAADGREQKELPNSDSLSLRLG